MRCSQRTVTKFAPRADRRGVDLISDALPFGRLWYRNSACNRFKPSSGPKGSINVPGLTLGVLGVPELAFISPSALHASVGDSGVFEGVLEPTKQPFPLRLKLCSCLFVTNDVYPLLPGGADINLRARLPVHRDTALDHGTSMNRLIVVAI